MFPDCHVDSHHSRLACFSWILLLFASASLFAEDFQGATHKLEYDQPPVSYTSTAPTDPIAALQKRIDSGALNLQWDTKYGYLPALLKELGVPASSQLLVFSKTSLQRKLIAPKTPRALYFNDDIYLGYIPGAPLMEVSAVDPKLGATFYHLPQRQEPKPRFVRDEDCMQCHGGTRSLGVPGHVVRSVGTDPTGELDSDTEVSEITHCTPIADRWAGWYVTGKHGDQTHRGNLVSRTALERNKTEPNFKGNLTTLDSLVDMSPYIEPTSDIVSHLVLEHQAHMHNYITRLNFETRSMVATYGHIRYLHHQVDAFLRYLLFTEEAPLKTPIEGNPAFVADFTRNALRDSKGRSLRDFDLKTRLFKYPCSFLIYTDSFDQLPEIMRLHIYQRLWDILTGKDTDPQFARLTAADRTAIREILLETKKGLPEYWRAGS